MQIYKRDYERHPVSEVETDLVADMAMANEDGTVSVWMSQRLETGRNQFRIVKLPAAMVWAIKGRG